MRGQRITIVGGGLVAWMAAACLARQLEALGVTITVAGDSVEVKGNNIAGPALHGFNAAIGLDAAAFVRETDAVPHLGAHQDGWFLPCGGFGADLDGIAFHHHWLRLLTLGGSPDLGRFSLEATAARDGKFGGSPGRPLTYGFRFDAGKYRALLRRLAMDVGVKHDTGGGNGHDADLVIDGDSLGDVFPQWSGRTVVLGASSAAEPLLPPPDLTIFALERLVALWPRPDIAPAAVARFNAGMAVVHREVRDFAVAHSVLSGHATAAPDSVAARIDLFRATGEIESAPGPVRPSDWLALFIGLGLRPRAVHPAAERVSEDDLKRRLAKVRTHIQDTVNALPSFSQ